jgi:hypothetical protein
MIKNMIKNIQDNTQDNSDIVSSDSLTGLGYDIY